MSLRMPGPWKHPKTGVYYLRQRAPTDLKNMSMAGQVAIPVGGIVKAVKAGPIVKVSLDTKDPSEAKSRYRDADAALHEFWQRRREGPQPLTQKQVQALAGILYIRLVDMMDSEPGEEGIWKEVLRLNKGKQESGELDPWFGPSVDALFAEQGVNTDPLSRTRVVHATFTAIQLAAEANLRKAQGDYSPDDARKRFPAWAAEPKQVEEAPRAAGDLDLFALLDHKFATQGLKPKTKDDYSRDLAKFVASSGHRDARDVTRDDVRAWRDELIGEGLSPSKINGKCLAALSAVLTHAVKEFSLSTNVAHGIRDGRKSAAPVRSKGYTAEEAKAILTATFKGTTKAVSVPHKTAKMEDAKHRRRQEGQGRIGVFRNSATFACWPTEAFRPARTAVGLSFDASGEDMARKKTYGEIIAEHIAAVVEDRQIEQVLHFTRLENLPCILEHGLQTRSELVNADWKVYASDSVATTAPNHVDQTPELHIVAAVLPAVDEAADDLKVVLLVVAVAVDPVERAQHLLVILIAVILEAEIGDRAEAILLRQQRV
jgi:hypothetical protein